MCGMLDRCAFQLAMAFRWVTLYGAWSILLGIDMNTIEGVQSARRSVDSLRIHHRGCTQSIPSSERE
jgi:hypothetical protein